MDENIELDALDHRILAQLQEDCSLSNQDLAARVHASAPTCLRRVRRLRELGVIEKEVALIRPGALGLPLTAIVEVTLDSQSADLLDAFEVQVGDEPNITQCYRVSSGPDFVLIVQLTDMPAYHALAHRCFVARHHVRNVRTFFSVHRAKFDTRIPR